MVLKKCSYLLLMNLITLLRKFNDVIVYQYFKWYIHDIKYLNNKKLYAEKNYMLNNTYLNICYKEDEYEKISDFVKKFKKYYDYIHINDISIAILSAYYTISLCEYDDYIIYNKLRKFSKSFLDVKRLYMGIVGISCSIQRENSCCTYINNKTYYDYDNPLNKELRQYLLFGIKT